MLDSNMLAADLVRHVTRCPSGRIVCSCAVAAESWFQVELAYMLNASNNFKSVQFGYDYPESRQKADVAAVADKGTIVFELKCFVKWADANKMEKWPAQLQRLLLLVQNGKVLQGVALSTFFGYKASKVSELACEFYPAPWNPTKPVSFFEDAPLCLVVATANEQVKAIA